MDRGERQKKCRDCGGIGQKPKEDCHDCHGEGGWMGSDNMDFLECHCIHSCPLCEGGNNV